MDEKEQSFGDYLRQLIKDAGMTQNEFYTALGIKKPYFYDIVSGRTNPPPYPLQLKAMEVLKNKLFEAYPRDWFVKAPVILIFSVDRALSWKSRDGKDFGDIDIAIAADHVTLAAADLGLGTCWLGAFDPVKCRQAVNLPEKLEPVIMMPLGYPEYTASPDRHSTRRKSLEDIIDWK